jgi:hypothetical protein
VCQKPWQLVFHHENYNLGKEKMGRDVFKLCWKHHQQIHYAFFGLIKLPIKPWFMKLRRRYLTYTSGQIVIRMLILLVIGLLFI